MEKKETELVKNSELISLYTKIKAEKMSKAIKPQPAEKNINIMPTPKKV